MRRLERLGSTVETCRRFGRLQSSLSTPPCDPGEEQPGRKQRRRKLCAATATRPEQAIDIAIRVLLAPGDEVWVEDPGYPLTHAQLLLAKARPHPIPVDAHGLIVDAGLRTAPRARAAFLTPSHQFPTGVALSMARRLELLTWARRSGAFIVEDDYTSELRYSGPPLASLQGLDDTEQVIYVGTLNKALFPGLRIG